MQAAHERNALSHGYAGEDRPSLRRNLNNLLASIDTLLKTPRKQRVGKRAKQSIDQLVDWFFEHYEDPANGVPYDSGEGGYQYFSGGPYDALDELAEAFPDLSEEVLSEAADLINQDSLDWVKKGQY